MTRTVILNKQEVEITDIYCSEPDALGGVSDIYCGTEVTPLASAEATEYKYSVESSEKVYYNNKPFTFVKIYRREIGENAWHYYSHEDLKGHFKRESTILKKLGYKR